MISLETWIRLVEERDAWVGHNFPDHAYELPVESVVGCLEEVGELAHCHLKEAQNVRMNEDHLRKAQDAIGDITVYALGVMSKEGIPKQWPHIATPDPWQALLLLGSAVGRLCSQEGEEACARLIMACENYCEHRGWDYETIVHSVWNEVKKRDWIAYPDTGLPPIPGLSSTPADRGCTRPPEGWYCTLEPEHDGPCAALPEAA